MPELPEVAVVIDGIAGIAGKKSVDIQLSAAVEKNKRYRVKKSLVRGSIISEIHQRGKYIVFGLEKPQKRKGYMVCHLGMSGRLTLEKPEKHCHMQIDFEDNSSLYFEDTRRFGFVQSYQDYHTLRLSLQKIGPSVPDYLRATGQEFPAGHYVLDDLHNAAAMFITSLRRHSRPSWHMKKVLMEQKAVSGYGNIYASEALFAVGIHPEMQLKDVSNEALFRLFAESAVIFSRAYLNGGSSISTYRDANGNTGNAQKLHKVYGRAGKPCTVCLEEIIKFKQIGRATYFCPICQPSAQKEAHAHFIKGKTVSPKRSEKDGERADQKD